MTEDHVSVDIGLPLPLDITATLINLIGTAYPGAMIETSGGRDWSGREVLRMQIPAEQRYAAPAARQEIEAAKRVLTDELDRTLTKFRDEVALATPEDLKYQLGYLVSRMFALSPQATNYLSIAMDIRDRDTAEHFVLTLQRATGKTPHQLRQEAETDAAMLRRRVAELQAQLPQSDNDGGAPA